MKLTLSKIYDSYITLQHMSENKLPVKISYAIYKNINIMKNEVTFLENERLKLGEEYVERDNENNPIPLDNSNSSYKIIEGKEKEYNEKYQLLWNTEVEIEPYKINLDLLLNSDIRIEPAIFEGLDFILE